MAALIEFVVGAALLGVLGTAGWAVWRGLQEGGGPQKRRLPARDREWLAQAIAGARWAAGRDEVDGETRVLIRRSHTGLDGHPVVLEERVLETLSAQDPAWEARFTEAMSRARFRCAYLNDEEAAG